MLLLSIIYLLVWLILVVSYLNKIVAWMNARDQKKAGIGCWYYHIGVLRKVSR